MLAHQLSQAKLTTCKTSILQSLIARTRKSSPCITRSFLRVRSSVTGRRLGQLHCGPGGTKSSERQNLEYWRGLFEYIAGIPFLTGSKSGSNGRAFFASLDWIVKPENFAKIREGRYEERAA